jgi:hypothetical protein
MTERLSSKWTDNAMYCMECSKFTKDEVVRYDSNDLPVVRHNNGHVHRVIFRNDIQFLLARVTPWRSQNELFEIAQMYGLSTQDLEQVLENVGVDL